MNYLSISDLIFAPVLIFIIYFIAWTYCNKKVETDLSYKYFLPGLRLKLFGGVGVCLVYTLYYPGGDTIQFYSDGMCLVRLLFVNPPGFFTVMTTPLNISTRLYFNSQTGYPAYTRDPETWFVAKLAFPFVLFSMQSFITSTILVASASFLGIWRLYTVFISEFPDLKKEMAIAIFFVPSVFFWGSGLLKDTFTLSAIGFLIHSFYMTFIKKNRHFRYFITFSLSIYIILSIKPYIFVGLLPGIIFWFVHNALSKVKGAIARIASVPLLVLVGIGSGYILLNILSTQLAEYSLDSVLKKAVTTQHDLKMDYYHGNSFDIGDFDPTIESMANKAPQAIFASLFRPFIFEANNIVMFVSSIENLVILIFTLRVLFLVRVYGIFRFFLKHHLLTFSLIFSLFFAFSVGISTSNFGSLVRYKIPCIPFYVASLFIIQHIRKNEIKANKKLKLQSHENEDFSNLETEFGS